MQITNMLVYRRKANISQTQLAQMVGVSQPRISNIESMVDDTPSADLLNRIARAIKYPGKPSTLQDLYVPVRPQRKYIGFAANISLR